MVPNCSSNSFSLFFPLCSSEGGGGSSMTTEEDNYSLYYFSSSSSSSSVDCTLSLGTPSTRNASTAAARVQQYSSPDGFGWDNSMRSTQSKTKQQPSFAAAAANAGSLGGDPLLLARRCANCDTTSTPLWRNGPKGPKSLCNACGIRYKKEERRASASTTRNGSESSNGYNSTNVYQQQQQCPWSCYQSTKDTSNSSSSSSSSWYQNNEDRYLSWRLNVVPPPQFDFDRPTLFH